MKDKLFPFALFVFGFCLIAGCGQQANRQRPQAKTSAALPIGYRQISEWTVAPARNGQGNGLQGLAVDDQGQVYIADAEGRRIVVFSPDGKQLKTIEADSRHPGILKRPFGLLLAGQDRLYVTDYDADQVQVFSIAGKFLFAWGREGKGKGEFRAPLGIDQDRNGNIYVVEFYGMRVQKFTSSGKFLAAWGSEAPWGKPAPPDQLLYPSGLAAGPDGNIYVTDSGHDLIKVFTPE